MSDGQYPPTKNIHPYVLFFVGIVICIAIRAILYLEPNTRDSYAFLLLLALGAVLVLACLPGTINVKIPKLVTATGIIGLFVLLTYFAYLMNMDSRSSSQGKTADIDKLTNALGPGVTKMNEPIQWFAGLWCNPFEINNKHEAINSMISNDRYVSRVTDSGGRVRLDREYFEYKVTFFGGGLFRADVVAGPRNSFVGYEGHIEDNDTIVGDFWFERIDQSGIKKNPWGSRVSRGRCQ